MRFIDATEEKTVQNKSKKIFFTTLAIIFFLIAATFLCACIEPIALSLMDFLKTLKPNLNTTKIAKLRGVLLGNVFLFCVFGILFILIQFVYFTKDSESIYTIQITPPRRFGTTKLLIPIFIVFLFSSGIRFFWMNQKIAFHIDEMYGISIATQNKYGLWSGKDFEKERKYTGKEIKDAIFFDDDSIKDTARDLAHLWIYNKDTAYNNLYLYLLRIWFSGVKTSDFKATIIRSSLLNYIFFCFAFYFLYLLLGNFTKKEWTKALILAMAFLNPASIGISVFMRSYALQEAMLLLFTNVFVFYYRHLKSQKDVTSKKNFMRTAIICALLFSTDYFSVLYLGILGIILLYLSIREKKYNTALFLLCAVFSGMFLSKCFYLNYGTGFFAGRGAEALSGLGDSIFSQMWRTVFTLNDFILKNMFPMIVLLSALIFGIFILYREEKRFFSMQSAVFISAILFAFLVLFVSPLTTLRYIAPIFALFPIVLIIESKNKKTRFLIAVCQCALCVVCIVNVLPLKQNFNKIEHLNDTNKKVMESDFLKNASVPVIIDRKAIYPEILPYLQDERTVYFADSMEQAKSYPIDADAFYFITHTNDENGRIFTESLVKKDSDIKNQGE